MKMFFVLILTATVMGCSMAKVKEVVEYTTQVASVVESIKYVDENIDSSIEVIYNSTFYTTDEQVQLEMLVKDVDRILRDLEKILNYKDAATATLTAAEIDELIMVSRTVYTEMYVIVNNHYNEYPAEVQQQLRMLNDNLKYIDRTWIKISTTDEGKDVTPIIKGVLQVIGTGISVGKLAI